MKELYLIKVTIFAIYTAILIRKYKNLPHSYSDSYYMWEIVRKNLGLIFTLWCFVTAFMTAPISFEIAEGKDYQFLVLFMCFGLGLVGAAPKFKTYEAVIHTVGAMLAAVPAVILTGLVGLSFLYLPYLAIAALLIFINPKSYVFDLEFAVFGMWFTVEGIKLWEIV